jgi:glycosyltransferase involved in cell wall biosynthesis
MQNESAHAQPELVEEKYLHQRNGTAATLVSPLPSAQSANGESSQPAASIAALSKAPAPAHRLDGKRGAVLLFSHYPADPRPRRAAEALAAEGVSIDLICLQENSDDLRRETINGVNVIRLPLKRRRRGALTYAWQYTAFIAACFCQLTLRSFRRRYDFVHVHNMPDVLVFSALVPKLCGAKIVLDLHDPMPELMEAIFDLSPDSYKVRALEQMEKWSIGFSDLVLTVSRTFEDLFSSRSCSSEKVKVVINSPDEQIFKFHEPQVRHRANGDLDTPFVILYHGSLLKRNGLDLAVDALEIVRQEIPNASLSICGRPTAFFDEVMESVRKRGLTPAVHYLGAKKLEGIVDAIRHCDVGVIPNHRNIFTELNTPTRILECLALGKPVVAPRARGIRDYFGEKDLVYFELGNARDLAAKIKYVYSNPEEVEQTVRRGQQIYQGHTWTAEKGTLLEAFNTLLNS